MQNSTVVGKLLGAWETYIVKNNNPFWLSPDGEFWPMPSLNGNSTRKIIAVIPEWV